MYNVGTSKMALVLEVEKLCFKDSPPNPLSSSPGKSFITHTLHPSLKKKKFWRKAKSNQETLPYSRKTNQFKG